MAERRLNGDLNVGLYSSREEEDSTGRKSPRELLKRAKANGNSNEKDWPLRLLGFLDISFLRYLTKMIIVIDLKLKRGLRKNIGRFRLKNNEPIIKREV